MLTQLDRCSSHTTVGSVLDEPLALPYILEILQHPIRSAWVHRHSADLDGRQSFLVYFEHVRFLGERVRAPCPESRVLHYDPVALAHGFDGRSDGRNFEAALIATDGAGLGCPEEGGEGWLGWVDALDLVYIRGVYGRCEGAQEEGVRGERGRDGVRV